MEQEEIAMQQQYVVNEFEKTCKNAFKIFSKKHGCLPAEIQIMMGLEIDEKAEEVVKNTYSICRNYKIIQSVTFKELLDVKIDFTGKSKFVPPIIANNILSLSSARELAADHLQVLIMPNAPGVRICLFNWNQKDKTKQPVYLSDISALDIIKFEIKE